jgi:succinylarginine dihydrolase
LFLHEQAWANQAAGIRQVAECFQRVTGGELQVWEVSASELPLAEAVRSYLFNSQLIRRGEADYVLVCPDDCRRSSATAAVLERLVNDATCSLQEVIFLDLRQSMNNGGGPACLRLRVVLDGADVEALTGNLIWTPELNRQLRDWVQTHYRETLQPSELVDPQLLREIADAGVALAKILKLPERLLLDPEWL